MDLWPVQCLAKPEWVRRFPGKMRQRDWGTTENIVRIQEVRCVGEAELSLHMM